MIRSWWFRISLATAFSFLLGFSYRYHLPRFEQFLLVEIERLSQKHSPVRVWAGTLSFHLFPLGVVLEDVRLLAKSPLDRYVAPATVKQMGARISLLPLLHGQVRLSHVFIRDSEFNIFLRQELFQSGARQAKKLDFEELYGLPIDEIHFERLQVQGRLDPQNVVFRISDFNLTVENRYRSLFLDLEAPRVLVKPSGPVHPLNVQLEVRTLIEAQEAQVSAFKLRADESFLVASGRFNGDIGAGKLENGAFDARAKIQLSDLNIWERVFLVKPRLPALSGLAETDIGMEIRAGLGHRIEGEIKTNGLQIDEFMIGAINGRLSSDLKSISSDQIRLENDSGRVLLQKAHLSLEPKPQVSGTVKAQGVNLSAFLANLGIRRVPLQLVVDGEAQCQGIWNDNPDLGCQAKIRSPRLHVHTGGAKPSTIVDVHDLNATGDFRVTRKDVAYKGELKVGKSSVGRSNGVIDYQTGFNIQYEGENVDFKDVKNLVNLKFEGVGRIKGNTVGTATWATLDLDFAGKNLWLEDYPFGELNTKMTYKNGHLLFGDVQGQYEVSRYNGSMDINLNEHRMKLSAQIPFADLRDLQSVFQRKLQLPFKANGTGQGRIEAQGPFRVQDMSYEIRSRFFRGQVAEETFDELVFNVKAVNGLVKSDQVYITKSSGVAELKGQITPKGEVDTVIVGRGMRLEQSENIINMGLDLQGIADFTLLIRGQLPRPRVELNGRLSRMVLGDQPAEDSALKLNFLHDRMEGSGQFLGQTLVTDFVWPYEDAAPFLFRAKAKQWDFTSLFSMVSRSARQLDFSTSVTGEVNLQSPSGGFWASNGQVQINEFHLRKGTKSMSSEKPMTLNMHDGTVNSKNFAISNGDSFLKLDVAGLRRDSLNASMNGKLDLTLLGLFTPFISDLRGQMALSMDLHGTKDKPDISGSAYIDKGYAKFTDFTHPFSNVRGDLIFNGNQIVINSVRADMASGEVVGDGKISFNGKTRPVEVKGSFQGVKLNVPENFRTHGSGTVAIHGNGFPYSMDIDYGVTSGEVTYEIGAETGGQTVVKASSYLPKFMYQEAFHPFTFLINVNLKNPVLVNNSLIQANVNGGMRVNGTPDNLLLTGTLTPSPGARVFFNDRPFEVTSAFAEYTGAPPQSPKIYLTATSRVSESVQDDQGRTSEQQYDVSLLVQGRGPSPEIVLSSQPPLSQREIVSLLALGVTSSRNFENQGAQTTNTGTAVGAGLLQKAAGRKIKDTFGVDVKVSSSAPTPDRAAQPTVTISKQWTPKFGASASSTLQANPSNNVKLEYKVNRKVSVIGSWDGRENNLVEQRDQATKNVFGLDLEYKVPFK
jgi:translocation and assembly module TamB